MPNHVTNILKITGDEESVRRCLSEIGTKNNPEKHLYIDFQKIIPRPESLNIISGSSIDNAIDILKGNDENFLRMMEYPWAKEKGFKNVEELKKHFKSQLTEKDFEEAFKAIENEKKYGCRDWYEWSNKNWGTKWNAYDQSFDEKNTITFDTAWNTPYPVIEKLAMKYPELNFKVSFADEDLGSNCGMYEFDGGVSVGAYFPNKKQALRFACSIKNVDFMQIVIGNLNEWDIEEMTEEKDVLTEMLKDKNVSEILDGIDTDTPIGKEKVKYLEMLCAENDLFEKACQLKRLT